MPPPDFSIETENLLPTKWLNISGAASADNVTSSSAEPALEFSGRYCAELHRR